MVIATSATNNANPAMERPPFAQLHGIRANEKQRCKLHYYVKLVDSLLMNSAYDRELTTSADNAFHKGIKHKKSVCKRQLKRMGV